ncbi:MAG: toxin HipA [Porphyromonadaceae bacterium CG2_30_38_12]|nr:MAG: toxin HipA [Porphyromonadaceae bacterium CG2_30_38_12]
MGTERTTIFVYAHWQGMEVPLKVGVLLAQQSKGRKTFSFEYDKLWLKSEHCRLIDPDLQFFSGIQYPVNKENFGFIFDNMPDTWGRTLMKRRNILQSKEEGIPAKTLYEIDFLLGVYDESRMGAFRFKTDEDGPFLDDNQIFKTPPWTNVRELQHAALRLEDANADDVEVKKWLDMLMAPGTSLGGARPKANILDPSNDLWIAKFPSKNDGIDKGAWEFLAYELALNAGIQMAESKIEKIQHTQHTFFTKRFDRSHSERIHFVSAMTMTGKNEEILRTQTASYLEIADFIQNFGTNVNENLEQLWRRIVFNIAISNNDDHLRNHGFLLEPSGWVLSPAYDLNPSVDKNHLSLNIDLENSDLDFELAKSVGSFFRLNNQSMDKIGSEVFGAVSQWEAIAKRIGIARFEMELMSAAFRKL